MLVKLDTFYSTYGSYHNNLVNKVIHMICIPQIVITGMGLLMFCDKQWLNMDSVWSVNVGTVVMGMLMSGYLCIDLVAGMLCTLFYVGCGVGVNWLYYIQYAHNQHQLWPYFLYIHLVAWAAQFIGHAFFERRAPALLDNIFYATIAPFFVILEVSIHFYFRFYLKLAINQLSIKVPKN